MRSSPPVSPGASRPKKTFDNAVVSTPSYGAEVTWEPVRPRLRPLTLIVSWVGSRSSPTTAVGSSLSTARFIIFRS